MSLSTFETRTKTSVATAAALSAYDDTPLASGDLAFVSDGVTGVYYTLLKKSVAVVDGASVLATKSGVGRWVLTSDEMGSQVTVPNYAALAALVDPAVPFKGGQVFVESSKSIWIADLDSTATPNNATVIARVGGGNWLRVLSFAHPAWFARDEWWIDAVAGSDEGEGSSNDPLATLREWSRRYIRWQTLTPPVAINLLTDIPTTDTIAPTGMVDDTSTFDPVELTVNGQRTTVYTGVFDVVTAPVPAANTPGSFDGGVGFVAATHLERMVVAENGSTAWIIKSQSAQVARISPWVGPAPLAGDSFTVVTLTSFRGAVILGGVPSAFAIAFVDLNLDGGDQIRNLHGVCQYSFSRMGRFEYQASGKGGQVNVYYGTLVTRNADVYPQLLNQNGSVRYEFSAALGKPLFISDALLKNTVLQGLQVTLASGSSADPLSGAPVGQGVFVSVGVFDAPAAAPAVLIGRNNTLVVETAFYGANQNAIGVFIEGGSTMLVIGTSLVPSITGTVQQLLFSNGEVIPTIDPVTGLGVAGAALTTFAAWDATYGRDALNPRDGTRLISAL